MADVIRIGVYGGIVRCITGIPQDVEILVYDYDTDGVVSELLGTDNEGNSCIVASYDSAFSNSAGVT